MFPLGIATGACLAKAIMGEMFMQLITLNPKFRGRDGEDTDDFNAAVAIEFDCPGCAHTKYWHRIWAPFQGRYDGPGPKWTATGSGYNDLTFHDAPTGTRSIRYLSGCKSHFNVTSGAIDFYGDSGHTQWSKKMNETAQENAGTDAAAETQPAAAVDPTVGPPGFAKTTDLKFIDGKLHQKWTDGHGVADPLWIPVASETTAKAEEPSA